MPPLFTADKGKATMPPLVGEAAVDGSTVVDTLEGMVRLDCGEDCCGSAVSLLGGGIDGVGGIRGVGGASASRGGAPTISYWWLANGSRSRP